MNEYDVSKDYYRILNVSDNCSLEDLKRAHVTAAMKYHPDTHASNSSPQNVENFRLISEAWQILSKPHLRILYDQARKGSYGSSSYQNNIYTGGGGGGGDNSSNYDDLNASIVNTQKENFATVRINSATNWRDLKDKYKTGKYIHFIICIFVIDLTIFLY
jgi:DnaJ-class molecular chaperone